MNEGFYTHTAVKIGGEEVPFNRFQGKVVLVVNIASKCGFTPQLKELESLYQKYRDMGVEILAFPCNQFLNQEPKSNQEIVEFCSLNYGVTFPVFEKIEVNGKNTLPLYDFLKSSAPGTFGKTIKWNFTKFLINREGAVVKRFAPMVKPTQIEGEIQTLLK